MANTEIPRSHPQSYLLSGCRSKGFDILCFFNTALFTIGLLSLLTCCLLLYRMRYSQNEPMTSSRSVIVYTAIVVCLTFMIHVGVVKGGHLMIASSFSILLFTTLIAHFFAGLITRRYDPGYRVRFQIVAALCIALEITLLIWALSQPHLNCHSAPFPSLAISQWLITLIIVWMIRVISNRLDNVMMRSAGFATPGEQTTPDVLLSSTTNVTSTGGHQTLSDSHYFSSYTSAALQSQHSLTAFVLAENMSTQLDSAPSSHNLGRSKQKDLWYLCIINVFATSVQMIYQIWTSFIASHCDVFFGSGEAFANRAFICFVRIMYVYVPVWMTLRLFFNWPKRPERHRFWTSRTPLLAGKANGYESKLHSAANVDTAPPTPMTESTLPDLSFLLRVEPTAFESDRCLSDSSMDIDGDVFDTNLSLQAIDSTLHAKLKLAGEHLTSDHREA